MIIYQHNGHVLELHDSTQDLPIRRFQLYNLNLLLDSGIGSDLSGFANRISTTSGLIKSDPDAAQDELNNLYMNVEFMMNNVSPEMRAFVVMLHKINDRYITRDDLTDSGIEKLLDYLSDIRITKSIVQKLLDRIKKKIDNEFEVFFPEMSDTPTIKEFYSNLKKRTLLVLESIITKSVEAEEQIKKIDAFLMSRIKPKIFHGSNGLEVRLTKSFDDACSLLDQYKLTSDASELMTFSFFQKSALLRQQLKKQQKK